MGNEAMEMNQSSNQSSSQPGSAGKPNLPVDVQAIVERVKDIIINPKQALDKLENQKISTNDIIFGYLAPLFAVSALCRWLGGYFGGELFFFGGLIGVVAMAAASLLGIYLLAFGIEKFLPKFQAQASVNDAVKLLAFAATPGLVANMLSIIPPLWVVGALGGLYGLYLLYLGIPKLLNVSAEKQLPVFGAIIVGMVVTGIVVCGTLYFVLFNILGIPVYRFDLRAYGADVQNIIEEQMRQLQKYSPNP